MSASLKDITVWLDNTLEPSRFKDSSANGLQVQGRSEVRRIGIAVDACMASFRAAADACCDLILVHHGLIWGGIQSVRGLLRERLALLLGRDISLYACHLPLDAHPELGNNALLARMAGVKALEPFGGYHGQAISFGGELAEPVDVAELARKIKAALGGPVVVSGDPRKVIRRLAVCSGGGTSTLEEAALSGYDALLTGEGNLDAMNTGRDLGFTVIFAGHYQTETLGVKALGHALGERFGLPTSFLDVPPEPPAAP